MVTCRIAVCAGGFRAGGAGAAAKKRTFKKFTFRGVDLDALLDMSSDELGRARGALPRAGSAQGISLPAISICINFESRLTDQRGHNLHGVQCHVV